MQSSTRYVIKQRLAWTKIHSDGVPVTHVCRHYVICNNKEGIPHKLPIYETRGQEE
jgi:hypothetical protein